MREPQPRAIHLKDYAPPAFNVEWPIVEALVSDKDKKWADFKG